MVNGPEVLPVERPFEVFVTEVGRARYSVRFSRFAVVVMCNGWAIVDCGIAPNALSEAASVIEAVVRRCRWNV